MKQNNTGKHSIKRIRKFPNRREHITCFYIYIQYSTKQCWQMCGGDFVYKPHHSVKSSWAVILESMTFPSNGYILIGYILME